MLGRWALVGWIFFAVSACGPLKCQTVQQSNWQDKNAPVYKYKTTVRCVKESGEHEDLTLISSRTPIKQNCK